jgi:2-C-methyl-D-erythritol 4-phosphate cytidylyltransferase
MAIKAYQVADLLRVAAGRPVAHRHTTALIAAAGSSTRMGGETSKQLLDIDGTPVLARTLMAHQLAESVDEIVLIARREDFEAFADLARRYGITKRKRITEGGDSRQASALRGLSVVSDQTKFIAISDGARCLVTPDMIDRINQAAWRYDAASAATPVTDTVKLVTKNGYTEEGSPDRSRVWLAQTPQSFSLPLYRAAAYYAKDNDVVATDDTSLVEAIGRRVKLVDCGKENIKITTPEDVYLARAILARRLAEQEERGGTDL